MQLTAASSAYVGLCLREFSQFVHDVYTYSLITTDFRGITHVSHRELRDALGCNGSKLVRSLNLLERLGLIRQIDRLGNRKRVMFTHVEESLLAEHFQQHRTPSVVAAALRGAYPELADRKAEATRCPRKRVTKSLSKSLPKSLPDDDPYAIDPLELVARLKETKQIDLTTVVVQRYEENTTETLEAKPHNNNNLMFINNPKHINYLSYGQPLPTSKSEVHMKEFKTGVEFDFREEVLGIFNDWNMLMKEHCGRKDIAVVPAFLTNSDFTTEKEVGTHYMSPSGKMVRTTRRAKKSPLADRIQEFVRENKNWRELWELAVEHIKGPSNHMFSKGFSDGTGTWRPSLSWMFVVNDDKGTGLERTLSGIYATGQQSIPTTAAGYNLAKLPPKTKVYEV